VSLLTDRTTPLGRAVGKSVEVEESVQVLRGGGPPDVVELTLTLAREMLDAAGLPDADPAAALADGRGMASWRALIRAQGGDPATPLPVAPVTEYLRAGRNGYVGDIDAHAVGMAAWRLGAGRARKEDPVSAGAGVLIHRRGGDAVRAGDVLLELRTENESRLPAALEVAETAVSVV